MPLDQAIKAAIAGMASSAKKKMKAKADKEKSDKHDCKGTGMGTKVHSKDSKKGGMHNHSCSGGTADASGDQSDE